MAICSHCDLRQSCDPVKTLVLTIQTNRIYTGTKGWLRGCVMIDSTTTNRIRKSIAGLVSISGITHVSQYWICAPEQGEPSATTLVSGFILLFLGLSLLLWQSRSLLWIVMILHAVVAPAHSYGLIFLGSTPFTVFHFMVVCLVVPGCAYLLFSKPGQLLERDL